MKLHIRALRPGPSKHRGGGVAHPERHDAQLPGAPAGPLGGQLEATPWPLPAHASPYVFSEPTVTWIREQAQLDLDQAGDFETQANGLLDQAAWLRRRGADLLRYLDAHDARAAAEQLPSGDDHYDYGYDRSPAEDQAGRESLDERDDAPLYPYWKPTAAPRDGETREFAPAGGAL